MSSVHAVNECNEKIAREMRQFIELENNRLMFSICTLVQNNTKVPKYKRCIEALDLFNALLVPTMVFAIMCEVYLNTRFH